MSFGWWITLVFTIALVIVIGKEIIKERNA